VQQLWFWAFFFGLCLIGHVIVKIVRALANVIVVYVPAVTAPTVIQNPVNRNAVKTRWANSGDIDSLQNVDLTVDWNIIKDSKYNVIIAENNKTIVGFYYFRLTKYSYVVENFFIRYDFRGLGYGGALLKELQRRCVTTQHKMIDIIVPEECLDFQMFLKAGGFECAGTSGAYHFIWRPNSS